MHREAFSCGFCEISKKTFFTTFLLFLGRLFLNGYGIQGKLLQESEMLAKLQSRDLVLTIS